MTSTPRHWSAHRDLGVPFEEAHALEGIGHSDLQDGGPGKQPLYLRQALIIDASPRNPEPHCFQQLPGDNGKPVNALMSPVEPVVRAAPS